MCVCYIYTYIQEIPLNKKTRLEETELIISPRNWSSSQKCIKKAKAKQGKAAAEESAELIQNDKKPSVLPKIRFSYWQVLPVFWGYPKINFHHSQKLKVEFSNIWRVPKIKFHHSQKLKVDFSNIWGVSKINFHHSQKLKVEFSNILGVCIGRLSRDPIGSTQYWEI